MSENYERLRKWAQDAAGGETDKIPYIDITDLISEVMKLRATAPVAEPVALSDTEIEALWDSLPGIQIHNIAASVGMSTQYALRIAFARAILAASQGASHG